MKLTKEDKKLALKSFLKDAESKYGLENCFDNSTYNPNGYSAQQDYNREMKSKELVRNKTNEMRDDLMVAIDKCKGRFDEIANERVRVLSQAVEIQDENLDLLEMRLQFYAELKKVRPDLELKLKTVAEIRKDIEAYLKKKEVARVGKEKSVALDKAQSEKLQSMCAHR